MKSVFTSVSLAALTLASVGCGTKELTEMTNADLLDQRNDDEFQENTVDLSITRVQSQRIDEIIKEGAKLGGVIVIERNLNVNFKLKVSPAGEPRIAKIPSAYCSLSLGAHLMNVSSLSTGGFEAQVHYPANIKFPQSKRRCPESATVVIQGKTASRFRGLALVVNTTSFEKRNKFDNTLPRVCRKNNVPVGAAKELSLSYLHLPKTDNACSVYAKRSHLRISGTHRSTSGQMVFSARAVDALQLKDFMFRMDECKTNTQLSASAIEITHAISEVTALKPPVVACDFPLPSDEK